MLIYIKQNKTMPKQSNHPIDDYYSYAEIARMTDEDIDEFDRNYEKGMEEERKERIKDGYDDNQ